MLSNKHFARAIVVFIAIALLGFTMLSVPTLANNHIDNEVNLGEENQPTIRYSTVVGLYGQPIDQASDDLVVELVELDESYNQAQLNNLLKDADLVRNSGIRKGDITVDGSNEDGVVVNTNSIYDQVVTNSQLDPQGDYVVREAIQGATLSVSDQHPEVPNGVDAKITNVELDSGDLKLTANTTSQTAGDADYTMEVDIDSDEVQETQGTTVEGNEPTLLVDRSQYNDVNYGGLDGIYDVTQVSSSQDDVIYPGTLTIPSSPGSFDSGDLQINHEEGTVSISKDIPEAGQLEVDYTEAENRGFSSKTESGPKAQGNTFDIGNSYLAISDYTVGSDSYLESPDYTDTTLDADITTQIGVFGDFQYVDGTTVSETIDDSQYSVNTPNIVEFDISSLGSVQGPIIADTLQVTDNGASNFQDSDINVIELNTDGTTRIALGDGSTNIADTSKLTISYERPGSGATVETATNREIVGYAAGDVTVGQTESLPEADIIVNVSGGQLTGDKPAFRVHNQSLGASNTTLQIKDDIDFQWTVNDTTSSLETVEFSRSVKGDVRQNIDSGLNGLDPNNIITNVKPSNGEFSYGFDMSPQQELEVSYNYYQANSGANQQLVTSSELGPDGVYQVDDPRVSPRSNAVSGTHSYELADATGDGFDASVESASPDPEVRIDPGTAGGVGGDVELSSYKYNISVTERYEGNNDAVFNVDGDGQSAELTFTPRHSADQAPHDFNLDVNTEDGTKSDTVTVDDTGNLPDGNELSNSDLNTLLVDSAGIDTGVTYAILVIEPNNADHDGDIIGVDVQEDGRDLENARIDVNEELDQYNGDQLTVQLMRYDNFQEPNGQPENVDDIGPNDVDVSNWKVVRNENINANTGSISQGSAIRSNVLISNSEPIPSSVDSENEGTAVQDALSQPWTLDPQFNTAGQRDSQDRRVYMDRLNLGESTQGPVGIPVGSEIKVAGNEFSPGDSLVLRPEDDTDRDVTWTADLEVEQSETSNENEVIIDTSVPSVENTGELSARFELVDRNNPDDVVFNYATTQQSIQTSIEPTFINLNADPTANLTVESQITNYDLLVSSEQLDAEGLLDDPGIFTTGAIDEYDIEIENATNDDNEQVRLKGLEAGEENIDLQLANVEEDEYGLQFDVVGANAEGQDIFQTAFGPEGSASFISPVDRTSQKTFRAAQGDRARIGVSVNEAEEVTLGFGDGNYPMEEMEIELEDGNEEFILTMDTYRANGEDANGNSMTFTDVFSLEGASFKNNPTLPDVEGQFDDGLYPMNLEVDNDETDLATLVLDERETKDVTTHVMPRGTDTTIENWQEEGTQQDSVAKGDMLVIDIQATGLDSKELITNNTDPAKLVNPHRRAEIDPEYDTAQEFVNQEVDGVSSVENASQVNLEIDGEKPSNRPSPQMLLEEATEIETVVDQGPDNRFFVFIDMNNNNVFDNHLTNTVGGTDEFDMFNSDSAAFEDYLTDYELRLNFTEEYPYVEDDDNDADFSTNLSVNERRVFTQLPVTEVNEEDLDTRFSLQQDSNATVRGNTYVAPGTEVSVVVRDDVSRTVVENPRTITQDVNVQEGAQGSERPNVVSGEFDLSNVEEGREMTIQFMGINDDRDPAIVDEPNVAPNITDISAESDGEGIFAGDEITFTTVINNTDPTTLSYEWNFGDGGSSGAPAPVHIYDGAGSYDVNLTVTDPQTGLTDSATLSDLVVTEVPRTAPEIQNIIAPEQLDVDEPGQFAVIATDDQASSDELIYEWDFGDGSTGTGISATNSYSISDTYTVEVTVSDPEDTEAQTTDDVLVEVAGSNQTNQNETQQYELEVFAQDANAGAPLPNTAIQIQDDQGQSVDVGQTNQQGTYTTQLDEGNYQIEGQAAGYNSDSKPVQLTSSATVQLNMQPQGNNTGGTGGNNTGENPDQPGFTLLLAAVGLAAAGGYIYYRRRIQ